MARQRTIASNSRAWWRPMRCQVAPSSELRSTPWLAVATRMVPFIWLLLHLRGLQEDAAGQPAVDAQRLTGDAARPRGGEEADGLADLLRGQDPADRRPVDEALLHLMRGDSLPGRFGRVELVDVFGLHHPW